MKRITFIGILAVMAMTAACTEDMQNDNAVETGTPLILSVEKGDTQSRAEDGNKLAEGTSIGIEVAEKGKRTYDRRDYSNVKATATGSGDAQRWTLDEKIWLSSTEGIVTAYCPYQKNTDMAAIPVETDSQTDYLYATPVSGVYNGKPEVKLTMQHMLAKITLQFVKGALKNDRAEITDISVEGEAVATSGVFNAVKTIPGFDSYSGQGEKVFSLGSTVVDDETVEILVVPTGIASPVQFTLKVDGDECTVVDRTADLVKGYNYNYRFVVHESHVILEQVQVYRWNENIQQETTIK